MRSERRISKNRYKSPRERFKSVLHGEALDDEIRPRWYRRRELFFPFIMIVVFLMLALVVKTIVEVQNQQISPPGEPSAVERPAGQTGPDEDKDMTYEEAKKIFGGTP